MRIYNTYLHTDAADHCHQLYAFLESNHAAVFVHQRFVASELCGADLANPFVSVGHETRQLTDDEWRRMVALGLRSYTEWHWQCSACKQLDASVQQVRDERRAVFAYLAQLGDSALLEALDYYF